MVRTQIRPSEDRHRRLRQWAKRLGISLSEAVRCCVADRLAAGGVTPSREERIRSALAVCGKYSEPEDPSRVAVGHDRHLAQAY